MTQCDIKRHIYLLGNAFTVFPWDVITLVVLVISVADLVTLLLVCCVTLFVVDRFVDCFIGSLALKKDVNIILAFCRGQFLPL